MPTPTRAAAPCLDARTAAAEFVLAVRARRHAQHPDDPAARWAWTVEERAELERLLAAAGS